MAIEHSDAFQALEKYSAAAEPQEINFPIVQEEVGTVFARPLSCSEMDKIRQKEGHEFNVRLCMAACQTATGKKLFNPEDFAGLYASRKTAAAFAVAANNIVSAQEIDYDALKRD
jgi:hypothetical protein